jgi:hypothetical protein
MSTRPTAFYLALTAAICADIVEARMYQWSSPGHGTVQLSGSPPAWYRSTTSRPRVLVFENGQLIDDTVMQVPEQYRHVLHAEQSMAAPDKGMVVEQTVAELKALLDA